MSVRGKVAFEMGIIVVLTTVFLVLFPKRNPLVDAGLAGFALLLIAISARYTKRVIWAASPPPRIIKNRFTRCLVVILWITVPAVVLFFLIGVLMGYIRGGWGFVAERFLDWKILAVFGAYMLWALIQQALFQFYLLGRLLVLAPKTKPMIAVVVTGVAISLVHLPDLWTVAATAIAGLIWTAIYYRFRLLLPLSFSHAALGTAFYYGLLGHDLAAEWKTIFP